MKILFLSQWYAPEPLRHITDLAETLRDQGHEVTVLTGFPNYPTGKLAPGYRIRPWQTETIHGIRVIRVPLYPYHGTGKLKRLANFASFAISSALLGPFLVRRPDVIHVYYPPMTPGVSAWLLSWLFWCPVTCEIQDLWPEVFEATGMMRSKRIQAIIGWYAKRIYKRTAAIRVISSGFRENLVGKGVPAGKVHLIPNWVDADIYQPQAPEPPVGEKLGLAGKFNVLFGGTIGLSQGLDAVLEAAEQLRDLPDVQIVLVGDGTGLARLKEIAAERRITNVLFLGRFPASAMPGLFAHAEVLLVSLRDNPLWQLWVPHKIYSYMACGKPVLAALEGDGAQVVADADAGLTCRPDPDEIAAAIRRFVAMKCDERKRLGQNGVRAVAEHYQRASLVAQVAEMMRSVIRK